jgi:hypothetical protein
MLELTSIYQDSRLVSMQHLDTINRESNAIGGMVFRRLVCLLALTILLNSSGQFHRSGTS